MNDQSDFPELNCKYNYRNSMISISQIAQALSGPHNGEWAFKLVVGKSNGPYEDDHDVPTPWLKESSGINALKAAKLFAEHHVDNME